jgi:hypothetical protein
MAGAELRSLQASWEVGRLMAASSILRGVTLLRSRAALEFPRSLLIMAGGGIADAGAQSLFFVHLRLV